MANASARDLCDVIDLGYIYIYIYQTILVLYHDRALHLNTTGISAKTLAILASSSSVLSNCILTPCLFIPEADFKATFLGNTPCGVYKYKFPKDVQMEGCVGAKVFFFKALLSAGSAGQKEPFLWAKKTELQGYLKPAYLEKVNRFILDL